MQITTLGARATLLLAVCILTVTACVYEIPIQQGNFLDATALVQVKKGMTRAQVRYLLGTPMVPGGFDNDRWDYDYYLKLRQLKTPRRARAAVYFHNDLVDHVDSDVMPVATDAAAIVPVSPSTTSPIVAPASDQTSTPGSPSANPPVIAPATDQTAAPTHSPTISPVTTPATDQAAPSPTAPSPAPTGPANPAPPLTPASPPPT